MDPDLQARTAWIRREPPASAVYRLLGLRRLVSTDVHNIEKQDNTLVEMSDYTPFQTASPLDGEMITVYNLNLNKAGTGADSRHDLGGRTAAPTMGSR